MLKATKVDGVYTADPKKDPTATRYARISFDEAISQQPEGDGRHRACAVPRPETADQRVFSIFKPGALRRVVMGEDEGTLVHV